MRDNFINITRIYAHKYHEESLRLVKMSCAKDISKNGLYQETNFTETWLSKLCPPVLYLSLCH